MFFGFHVDVVEPGAHVTGLNIDHTQLKMARELLKSAVRGGTIWNNCRFVAGEKRWIRSFLFFGGEI